MSPDPFLRLLRHPWLPGLLAVLGVLLALPSLWVGLAGDDWVHVGILNRVGFLHFEESPLWTFFRFMPGGAGNQHLLDAGIMPWWADFEMKAAFFRPLSVLTHMLDHAVAPSSYGLHHLHSLGWYALVCGLATLLLRRFIGVGALGAAGLAALLFAVEDAHGIPAAWIANRNALVSMSLGLGALLLHLRGRAEGRVGLQAGALPLFVLALLAGESGLGALAYLGAWELCCGPGSLRRRAGALAPWLGVVLLWRIVYNNLGYGASGGGLYIDPGREPLVFLGAAALRLPVLALGQWLQAPVELYLMAPRTAQWSAAVVGALVMGGVALLALPTLRASAPARGLALGSILALVPVCAAFPMDRLLMWPGLGAFGLLGLVAADHLGGSGWRRWVTGGLLLLHGPLAALLLVGRAAMVPVLAGIMGAGARGAPVEGDIEHQSFIFLNGTEIPVVYVGLIRAVAGVAPVPRKVALLASLRLDNDIEVRDASTLVYRVEEGFLDHPSDNMFRNPDLPFTVGQRIQMADFQVEIEALTDDGRPRQVAVRFEQPLDSGSLRWLAWRDGAVVEVTLPPVGGHLLLPATWPLPQPPLPGEGPGWLGMGAGRP